jgi:hypothetical protein
VDNWYTFDDFDSVDIISNPAHQLYSVAVDQLQQVSKLDYITISPLVLSKL